MLGTRELFELIEYSSNSVEVDVSVFWKIVRENLDEVVNLKCAYIIFPWLVYISL